MRRALKRMKAAGADDVPAVWVWKCLGEAAVEFLTRLFNKILESESEGTTERRGRRALVSREARSCGND